MSNETTTLMTDSAETTNEGQTASTTTEQSATGAESQGQQQQATTEQTAAEGDADTGKTDEAKKPEGAPESYEWGETQFDSEVLTAFSEVAKDLNLSQDAASKVLDKMGPVLQARQEAQFEAARNEWAETSKADKEFGGEKLQENLGFAKRAMDAYATQELKALLNDTGLGNHPEVIRFFVKAGKAISEDTVVTGAKGAGTESYNPKRLYPNSNMN
jgi:hypothetical protein